VGVGKRIESKGVTEVTKGKAGFCEEFVPAWSRQGRDLPDKIGAG